MRLFENKSTGLCRLRLFLVLPRPAPIVIILMIFRTRKLRTLRHERYEIDTTLFIIFYLNQNFVLPFLRLKVLNFVLRDSFVACVSWPCEVCNLVTHAPVTNLLSGGVDVFRTRMFSHSSGFCGLFVFVDLTAGGWGWGGNFILHKVCRFCCYLSYISLIHFNSLHQFMYCLSRNQRLALNSTDVFFYCDNFTYMFRPVILQSSRWHFCSKNTVWSDGSHWATVLKYIECRLEFSVCWYKIM